VSGAAKDPEHLIGPPTAHTFACFTRDAARLMALVQQLRAERVVVERLTVRYRRLVDAARPRDARAVEFPTELLKVGDTIAWVAAALTDADQRLGTE
jgi:hypothetical protein